MPSDRLQIALDHHRAGRLTAAAAGYRALIDADANDAEAHHWLGVLAFQAGRADQAVPLLERAAALNPGDAAYLHNLGQAYLAVRRVDDAVRTFERAAKLVPDRAETLHAWGLAHLARGSPGDAPAAVFALRQAKIAGLDTAAFHHHLGLAHLAANQADDAIEAFTAAWEKTPDDPDLHHHLAHAYRIKDDAKAVRRHLNKALELDPQHARSWFALATLDAEAGNLDIAAGLYRKAVKAKADYPAAHRALGRVLERAGRRGEATAAYADALRAGRRVAAARDSASAATALPAALLALENRLTDNTAIERHHAMAANADIFSPSRAPLDAVARLFDRYAEKFDAHLVGQLAYRVPELIVDAVAAHAPWRTSVEASDPAGVGVGADASAKVAVQPFADALDLGCGTGLCGPLLRPLASNLAGVDLSPQMIEKARERGVYDHLHVGELVETLQRVPRGFDLLVAADVLIYLGDLGPTFEAAAAALRPGGLFAFSLEAMPPESTEARYHLNRKTLRFTHTRAYVERLAQIHGFERLACEDVVPRMEGERPVRGYLVVLRLPGV